MMLCYAQIKEANRIGDLRLDQNGEVSNGIERSDSLPQVGEGGPWNTVDEAALGANEYILQNIVTL